MFVGPSDWPFVFNGFGSSSGGGAAAAQNFEYVSMPPNIFEAFHESRQMLATGSWNDNSLFDFSMLRSNITTFVHPDDKVLDC